jgi:methanogenic corrinoid protein MtbC1
MALVQQIAGNAFASEILERGASGYAGFSASLMLERDPELSGREEVDALSAWRSHLTQRVLELAAAVLVGESVIFTNRVSWSRRAYTARGQRESDLRDSLQALRDVLVERLPKAALDLPVAYLDTALTLLDASPLPPEPSALDPKRPTDRLALVYLNKILEGNIADAIEMLVAEAMGSIGPQSAYIDVLLPAQREVGRLWHAGDISVAEEHMVTAATQRTMAVLASRAAKRPANGCTVVVAAMSGNVHDVALRALADLYQLDGWRVIFIGSDVPLLDLPKILAFYETDLLMLGATISTQLPRVKKAIEAIRGRFGSQVRVVVGGAAFNEAPDLWEKVGSDGYAATIDDALKVGARLAGLPDA